MEYNLKISESTVQAEVDIQEDRQLKVSMEQKTYCTTYNVISRHQIHLDVDGKGYNIFLADESVDSKTIIVNGRPFRVEDVDVLAQQSTSGKGHKDLPGEVTPPMPAVVVRLLVNQGDSVKKGDGIIVVSAMKMETTLTAPYNGLVARVNVQEGDKVSPGQILVDIEENE